jgi:hypothetical protein
MHDVLANHARWLCACAAPNNSVNTAETNNKTEFKCLHLSHYYAVTTIPLGARVRDRADGVPPMGVIDAAAAASLSLT